MTGVIAFQSQLVTMYIFCFAGETNRVIQYNLTSRLHRRSEGVFYGVCSVNYFRGPPTTIQFEVALGRVGKNLWRRPDYAKLRCSAVVWQFSMERRMRSSPETFKRAAATPTHLKFVPKTIHLGIVTSLLISIKKFGNLYLN